MVGGVAAVPAARKEGGNGNPPLRVSFLSMTRAEAIVATLVLLESFATGPTGAGAVTESEAEALLPAGLFIGAGPGTKGNAQRRMLAVENVLRAASLPCETVEDPRTYVIGVTREDLRDWIKKNRTVAVGASPAPKA